MVIVLDGPIDRNEVREKLSVEPGGRRPMNALLLAVAGYRHPRRRGGYDPRRDLERHRQIVL